MSTAPDLARMVPGFEFLQNLMKGAGATLPGLQGFGAWVAPTLDPEELDKRIQELKTVQFWLEQNARLLGTTVQALEVQRMTLNTLKTMNLPMADLRDALSARAPENPAPAPAPAPAEAAAAPAPPAVDPMQWWGALTQQFADIAAQAAAEGAPKAAARPAAETAAANAAKNAAKASRKPAKTAAAKTTGQPASQRAKPAASRRSRP